MLLFAALAALAIAADPTTMDGTKTKEMRTNEEAKWTSLCTHVHCEQGINDAGHKVTQVHSHSKEKYGHKHLCKMHLHKQDFCGCECYDESMGMESIFAQITEQAKAFHVIKHPDWTNSPTPAPDACPADTQSCADGSFVGRNHADSCNFFPCPQA